MKKWLIGSFGWLAVVGLMGAAVADFDAVDEFEMDESNATIITSTRLIFDQQKQWAVFEENVRVQDQTLEMVADRLTVYFDDQNQAKRIEAVGNVQIWEEETRAWAGKASYDVATGGIVMEEQPRIRRGRDLLEGETITFWRDTQKLICEPQARLVFFPEEGTSQGWLFGE